MTGTQFAFLSIRHPFQLIRVLIFVALALLQASLLISGQIRLYQAPHMLPFFIFSTAAFVLLAGHGLVLLRRRPTATGPDLCSCPGAHAPSGQVKTAAILLFGLVLATGFVLPHHYLDGRVAEKKGISLSRSPGPSLTGSHQDAAVFPEDHLFLEEDIPWDSAESMDHGPGRSQQQEMLRDELGIWYDQDIYTRMSEELLARESLRITGESFLDAMLVISAYLDAFIGKEVEFSGFVHHDGTMAENELAVARIAVTCCLADATVYGLLVRINNLPVPANDSWVRVRGRIASTRFIDRDIPLILADELRPIDQPDQPYVYPSLYSTYVFGEEEGREGSEN